MNHKEMNAGLARLCGQAGVWFWINAGEMWQYGTGFVDAIVIGTRGALFIENKTENGRRTRAQVAMGNRLTGIGLGYRLYRPADYASGAVRRDLEKIA